MLAAHEAYSYPAGGVPGRMSRHGRVSKVEPSGSGSRARARRSTDTHGPAWKDVTFYELKDANSDELILSLDVRNVPESDTRLHERLSHPRDVVLTLWTRCNTGSAAVRLESSSTKPESPAPALSEGGYKEIRASGQRCTSQEFPDQRAPVVPSECLRPAFLNDFCGEPKPLGLAQEIQALWL